MGTDFSYATQAVRGKIHFYTDSAKDATPRMTIRQDIGKQLGPILVSLGRKYSPVRKTQGRIYVLEDQLWSLRGRFNEALNDPDPVEWDAAADGTLTLSIMSDLGIDTVNQIQSVSSISGPSSASSGNVQQSEQSTSMTWDKGLKPFNIQIATIMGITPGSTKRTKSNLQEAYTKYLAVLKLITEVKQHIAAGTWPIAQEPHVNDMVEVFVAKSSWYSYYTKLFPQCSSNPLLLKWLQGEADDSETNKVWGGQSPTFANLMTLLELSDKGSNTASGSKERKTKDKGKGKDKDKDKKSHKKSV